MKIPEPTQKPNGKWLVQVQIDGRRVSKTFDSRSDAVFWASGIKTEKVHAENKKRSETLSEAIDRYIERREFALSALTIRGYRTIQKNRFKSVMGKRIEAVNDWQYVVNQEAKLCSAKTLKNAYGFIRSVVEESTGKKIPECKLPQQVKSDKEFLTPEQIPAFVDAVAETRYAVPLLLALSSLRISEISALRWEDIPQNPKFIKVRGAVVLNENNEWVRKNANKNESSARNVPILIPQLKAALERDRKDRGQVLDITQNSLRTALKRICAANNLPDMTVHGLRHSFASLAYHLQIPERITMEIGGWSDQNTMRKIYTHIAQTDIKRYQNALAEFYAVSE